MSKSSIPSIFPSSDYSTDLKKINKSEKNNTRKFLIRNRSEAYLKSNQRQAEYDHFIIKTSMVNKIAGDDDNKPFLIDMKASKPFYTNTKILNS
jgi:hypothetical protein